jgi:hypothetical protein
MEASGMENYYYFLEAEVCSGIASLAQHECLGMFYEVMDANVFALPAQFYKTPAKYVCPTEASGI